MLFALIKFFSTTVIRNFFLFRPNRNTEVKAFQGFRYLLSFLQSLVQSDEPTTVTSFFSILLEINQSELASESDQTVLQNFACGVLCR